MGTGPRVRESLPRLMRRVAVAAGVMVILRLITLSWLPSDEPAGLVIAVLTFLTAVPVAVYYGYRALRWLWRKILWRVRRRLVITYLFVGLTPIVLVGCLALIAIWGMSSEAMARLASTQVDSLLRETLMAARLIAAESAGDGRKPAAAGPAASKPAESRLESRARALEAALPHLTVAVWRRGLDAPPDGVWPPESAAHGAPGGGPQPTARQEAEAETPDPLSDLATLPDWLKQRDEFSGLVYSPPPENSRTPFATPVLVGLARAGSDLRAGSEPHAGADRRAVALVSVPLTPELVDRLRAATGLHLRPFFIGALGAELGVGPSSMRVETTGPRDEDGPRPDFKRDQFGKPLADMGYIVLTEATDWHSGQSSRRLLFVFDWSLGEVAAQLLGGEGLGKLWRIGLIVIGILFLMCELGALLVTVLITREVTGTVHELYEATRIIEKGDFSHRVRARSKDQLGELADRFNDMSAHIESLLEERVARERLEREVQIAAQVQSQLFPRSVPALASAEIAGECRAARGVAGDYYDYLELAPGRVALALGDVSGKGLSASLVMSNLQASLRAQTGMISEEEGMKGGPLARLAERINLHLCRSTGSNRFATLFIALYDDSTRTLRYTNAGHNPPILVRSNGAIERLTVGGMVVGVAETARYGEADVEITPGSVLVIFSDGISEAEDVTERQYGEEPLARFAAQTRGLGATEMLRAIFEEVDRWSAGCERLDDQTLVVMKGLGPARIISGAG